MQKRSELLDEDSGQLIRRCLVGTHTILMDDGINDEETVHSFSWHDQFTTGKTKRIVRIETVAADIMRVLCDDGRTLPSKHDLDSFNHVPVWVAFLQAFETAVVLELRTWPGLRASAAIVRVLT